MATAYPTLTREQYLKQYTDTLIPTYENEYQQKLLANQQALQKALGAYDTQRTGIQNQYQTSLNKLNEEKAAQLPQFTNQANQVSAAANINARRLAELRAQLGLLRGGGTLTGLTDIYNRATGAINDINTQKTNYLASAANRAAELANAYNADIADIERQRALAQTQATEYERSLAEELARNRALANAAAQAAWEDYAYKQKQFEQSYLAQLMNFLINQASQTGSWASPSQFTYGDTMVELLKRLSPV